MLPARFRFPLSLLACLAAVCALAVPAEGKDDWQPITPEELALKDNPSNPGSDAMILYREMHTDDINRFERHYRRIKIFTERGKDKYGEVEILYFELVESIGDIKARTIRPDGSIVEFSGPIFDKALYKRRGVKFLTKAFAFPEVEVGSIVEYQYTKRWKEDWFPQPTWLVQDRLFTRQAHFFYRPFSASLTQFSRYRFSIRKYVKPPRVLYTAYLPGSRAVQIDKDNNVVLETSNVPGFPEEDFMPPEDQLKWRVEFFYTYREDATADDFWRAEGKEWDEVVEEFIGKRKGMEKAVAELVSPSDPPEARLRKLYAGAQQIRNLTFERLKTEQEEKRETPKENKTVEDVLKNRYGNRNEINRLFVALARAAGFPAQVVRVAERDEYIFQKNLLDSRQLSGEVALVTVEGREMYLDPGTPFCPFGLLSWEKTGVQGIRLTEGGGVFVKTPPPDPSEAVTERQGEFELDAEGALTGTLRVTFHGHEAMDHRLEGMESDETGRRKSLEEEVKKWLPATAVVELQTVNNWESTEELLQAEFRLEIPEFAASTGRRLLVPVSVFRTQWQNSFRYEKRAHPIQFAHPFEYRDEIVVRLPAEAQVESLPAPKEKKSALGLYELATSGEAGTLRFQRHVQIKGYAYGREYYSILRSFFDAVRTGDGDQAVLQTVEAAQR